MLFSEMDKTMHTVNNTLSPSSGYPEGNQEELSIICDEHERHSDVLPGIEEALCSMKNSFLGK